MRFAYAAKLDRIAPSEVVISSGTSLECLMFGADFEEALVALIVRSERQPDGFDILTHDAYV